MISGTMKILAIGDIVGEPGLALLRAGLRGLLERHAVDYCIANVENAAEGFGVTPAICEELVGLGVDCLTSGNHIWDKRESAEEAMKAFPQLLRPINYPAEQPGRGSHVGRSRTGGVNVATVNVSGRVFMGGSIDDPFQTSREEVDRLSRECPVIVVDVHAQASSEKTALGYYLDGRVSAVLGTHTHVPTCDHRLLPKGTAYCTDLGMTGPYESIVGMQVDNVVQKYRAGRASRNQPAEGDPRLGAAIVTVDPNTGRALGIERFLLRPEDLG